MYAYLPSLVLPGNQLTEIDGRPRTYNVAREKLLPRQAGHTGLGSQLANVVCRGEDVLTPKDPVAPTGRVPIHNQGPNEPNRRGGCDVSDLERNFRLLY